MTNKQLYDLFRIKPYVEPARPKRDVIVSEDAGRLFKLVAKSVEQNHSSKFSVSYTSSKFSVSYTNRLITEYDDNLVVKYTIFVSSDNLEILRGASHDTCYVDSTIDKETLYELEATYFPCFKKIIILDKPDTEEA